MHFLIAGPLIFVMVAWAQDAGSEDEIRIDKDALLGFLQYKAKAFDGDYAEAQFAALSSAELRELIDQFAREEILVREARAMGLDKDDFVIRQRLLGKMEYLANGRQGDAQPTDAQIAAYFEANRSRYVAPASVSLTHVFLTEDRRTRPQLENASLAMLTDLRSKGVLPETAGRYGDRYLYSRNYIASDKRVLEGELGPVVAEAALSDRAKVGEWSGPFYSDNGAHLLYVLRRKTAGTPDLADVKDEVVRDFVQSNREIISNSIEREIAGNYNLAVSDEVSARLDAK